MTVTQRRRRPGAVQVPCDCDPRHLEVGAYDAGCPKHDPEQQR